MRFTLYLFILATNSTITKIVFVALPDNVGCLAVIVLDGVEHSGDVLEGALSQDKDRLM